VIARRFGREFPAQLFDVIDGLLVSQKRRFLHYLLCRASSHFYILLRREEIEAGFEMGRGPRSGRRILRAAPATITEQAAACGLRKQS
jgi:hypothetical protein